MAFFAVSFVRAFVIVHTYDVSVKSYKKWTRKKSPNIDCTSIIYLSGQLFTTVECECDCCFFFNFIRIGRNPYRCVPLYSHPCTLLFLAIGLDIANCVFCFDLHHSNIFPLLRLQWISIFIESSSLGSNWFESNKTARRELAICESKLTSSSEYFGIWCRYRQTLFCFRTIHSKLVRVHWIAAKFINRIDNKTTTTLYPYVLFHST